MGQWPPALPVYPRKAARDQQTLLIPHQDQCLIGRACCHRQRAHRSPCHTNDLLRGWKQVVCRGSDLTPTAAGSLPIMSLPSSQAVFQMVQKNGGCPEAGSAGNANLQRLDRRSVRFFLVFFYINAPYALSHKMGPGPWWTILTMSARRLGYSFDLYIRTPSVSSPIASLSINGTTPPAGRTWAHGFQETQEMRP